MHSTQFKIYFNIACFLFMIFVIYTYKAAHLQGDTVNVQTDSLIMSEEYIRILARHWWKYYASRGCVFDHVTYDVEESKRSDSSTSYCVTGWTYEKIKILHCRNTIFFFSPSFERRDSYRHALMTL